MCQGSRVSGPPPPPSDGMGLQGQRPPCPQGWYGSPIFSDTFVNSGSRGSLSGDLA